MYGDYGFDLPYWVGLGWVALQACFVGWVGSISYWVGLGWITENGPTSMSASAFYYTLNTHIVSYDLGIGSVVRLSVCLLQAT